MDDHTPQRGHWEDPLGRWMSIGLLARAMLEELRRRQSAREQPREREPGEEG